MKICTQCGATILEDEKFCGNCGNNLMMSGATMDEEPEENYNSQAYVQNRDEYSGYSYQAEPQTQYYEQQHTGPNYQQASPPYSYSAAYGSDPDYVIPPSHFDEKSLPEKYKPISAFGYVGYGLLFSIPLVGLILAIVFAVSDKKINRRNYARSLIIIYIIGLVFAVAGFFIFKEIIYTLISIISKL